MDSLSNEDINTLNYTVDALADDLMNGLQDQISNNNPASAQAQEYNATQDIVQTTGELRNAMKKKVDTIVCIGELANEIYSQMTIINDSGRAAFAPPNPLSVFADVFNGSAMFGGAIRNTYEAAGEFMFDTEL